MAPHCIATPTQKTRLARTTPYMRLQSSALSLVHYKTYPFATDVITNRGTQKGAEEGAGRKNRGDKRVIIGGKEKAAISMPSAKDFQPRLNFFDATDDASIVTEKNPTEGTKC